jgi:hypothetical protein
MKKLSRREFLVLAATIGMGIGPLADQAFAQVAGSSKLSGKPIPAQRVVHTHSDQATHWDYQTGWYGDYVDQTLVDRMTERGIMDLTRAPTPADAWRVIIPAYTAGQKVAIKINLNNATYDSHGQVIDALPQPINAVIKGLKTLGLPENDIWVYDVTNGWHRGEIPARLMKKVAALYPGVQFHSNDDKHTTSLGYSTTERIIFHPPPGRTISPRPICNALVQASYLINMPIMKKHRMAGVSLSFKHHFGSIDGCDQVHWSTTLADPSYLPGYSGLLDIYHNPHIKGKTVLIMGDGLYGARINNYSEIPSPWPTLGGKSPNSLFFSRDPVAIDSVMFDFLEAEGGVPAGSDNYLKLASVSGLGTFEHRDASKRYHLIDYRRIEV